MSKREVLLDRNSLIEHLKGCGHEEDMLFGMSDKGLFELYSNAMYENDLENYHASDANTDEYTIGLGDDIELSEEETVITYNINNPKDKETIALALGAEKNDVQGSGQLSVRSTPENEGVRFNKKTLEEKFAKAKPRTDESLEADKKLVMEMVGKHLRPVATKGKIMEYILNKSK